MFKLTGHANRSTSSREIKASYRLVQGQSDLQKVLGWLGLHPENVNPENPHPPRHAHASWEEKKHISGSGCKRQ